MSLSSFVNLTYMHIGVIFFLLSLRFVHPRFGAIKCIRTIRAVHKNEELTVAYGYDHETSGKSGPEAPDWYKQELCKFQQREAATKGDQN